MVIKELAYKFYEKDEFIPIPITGYSGSFSEKPKQTSAGSLFNTEASAYLPNINIANDTLILAIFYRKAIFRIIDSAGIQYIIGDDTARASLDFEKINEGKPGAKHGYNLKISLQYTKPAKMQVL